MWRELTTFFISVVGVYFNSKRLGTGFGDRYDVIVNIYLIKHCLLSLHGYIPYTGRQLINWMWMSSSIREAEMNAAQNALDTSKFCISQYNGWCFQIFYYNIFSAPLVSDMIYTWTGGHTPESSASFSAPFFPLYFHARLPYFNRLDQDILLIFLPLTLRLLPGIRSSKTRPAQKTQQPSKSSESEVNFAVRFSTFLTWSHRRVLFVIYIADCRKPLITFVKLVHSAIELLPTPKSFNMLFKEYIC